MSKRFTSIAAGTTQIREISNDPLPVEDSNGNIILGTGVGCLTVTVFDTI